MGSYFPYVFLGPLFHKTMSKTSCGGISGHDFVGGVVGNAVEVPLGGEVKKLWLR